MGTKAESQTDQMLLGVGMSICVYVCACVCVYVCLEVQVSYFKAFICPALSGISLGATEYS